MDDDRLPLIYRTLILFVVGLVSALVALAGLIVSVLPW